MEGDNIGGLLAALILLLITVIQAALYFIFTTDYKALTIWLFSPYSQKLKVGDDQNVYWDLAGAWCLFYLRKVPGWRRLESSKIANTIFQMLTRIGVFVARLLAAAVPGLPLQQFLVKRTFRRHGANSKKAGARASQHSDGRQNDTKSSTDLVISSSCRPADKPARASGVDVPIEIRKDSYSSSKIDLESRQSDEPSSDYSEISLPATIRDGSYSPTKHFESLSTCTPFDEPLSNYSISDVVKPSRGQLTRQSQSAICETKTASNLIQMLMISSEMSILCVYLSELIGTTSKAHLCEHKLVEIQYGDEMVNMNGLMAMYFAFFASKTRKRTKRIRRILNKGRTLQITSSCGALEPAPDILDPGDIELTIELAEPLYESNIIPMLIISKEISLLCVYVTELLGTPTRVSNNYLSERKLVKIQYGNKIIMEILPKELMLMYLALFISSIARRKKRRRSVSSKGRLQIAPSSSLIAAAACGPADGPASKHTVYNVGKPSGGQLIRQSKPIISETQTASNLNQTLMISSDIALLCVYLPELLASKNRLSTRKLVKIQYGNETVLNMLPHDLMSMYLEHFASKAAKSMKRSGVISSKCRLQIEYCSGLAREPAPERLYPRDIENINELPPLPPKANGSGNHGIMKSLLLPILMSPTLSPFVSQYLANFEWATPKRIQNVLNRGMPLKVHILLKLASCKKVFDPSYAIAWTALIKKSQSTDRLALVSAQTSEPSIKLLAGGGILIISGGSSSIIRILRLAMELNPQFIFFSLYLASFANITTATISHFLRDRLSLSLSCAKAISKKASANAVAHIDLPARAANDAEGRRDNIEEENARDVVIANLKRQVEAQRVEIKLLKAKLAKFSFDFDVEELMANLNNFKITDAPPNRVVDRKGKAPVRPSPEKTKRSDRLSWTKQSEGTSRQLARQMMSTKMDGPKHQPLLASIKVNALEANRPSTSKVGASPKAAELKVLQKVESEPGPNSSSSSSGDSTAVNSSRTTPTLPNESEVLDLVRARTPPRDKRRLEQDAAERSIVGTAIERLMGPQLEIPVPEYVFVPFRNTASPKPTSGKVKRLKDMWESRANDNATVPFSSRRPMQFAYGRDWKQR
ncbi:hypothetical protein HDU97_003091 [Phlyctochytrium planicorne]|nr:hypothetical protein HDU97_003043 [Phlyctochytrium planicorne]KAJ3109663.1 hypothetical protein HDU97_003091 [Phlyctochytrium planicorne]